MRRCYDMSVNTNTVALAGVIVRNMHSVTLTAWIWRQWNWLGVMYIFKIKQRTMEVLTHPFAKKSCLKVISFPASCLLVRWEKKCVQNISLLIRRELGRIGCIWEDSINLLSIGQHTSYVSGRYGVKVSVRRPSILNKISHSSSSWQSWILPK
jgi:hypothetical protein